MAWPARIQCFNNSGAWKKYRAPLPLLKGLEPCMTSRSLIPAPALQKKHIYSPPEPHSARSHPCHVLPRRYARQPHPQGKSSAGVKVNSFVLCTKIPPKSTPAPHPTRLGHHEPPKAHIGERKTPPTSKNPPPPYHVHGTSSHCSRASPSDSSPTTYANVRLIQRFG